jgi:hypothetical protein
VSNVDDAGTVEGMARIVRVEVSYCTWCNGYGSSLKDPEGGQFCPLIPADDLEPLLAKARNEGTILPVRTS